MNCDYPMKNVWHYRKIVVDATSISKPISSFLKKSLGSRAFPFHFTQKSKSELGFYLPATVNSSSLKIYRGECSAEYGEFWIELERAKSQHCPNQTMNFYVDPAQGYDDFLTSLALLVKATNQYVPQGAKGNTT